MPVAGANVWSISCYVDDEGRVQFGRQTYRLKMLVMDFPDALASLKENPQQSVILPVFGNNIRDIKELFEGSQHD